MACPHFCPVERLESWRTPPRLPLGDPYAGLCQADPLREWRPDELTLREYCNFGYARGRCSRFPPAEGPDAVRFMVSGEEAGVIRIHYVIEHDHAPLEHGQLEYVPAERRFQLGHPNELVRHQAQAYVESYLRRKSAPQNEARFPSRR